ncbi:MAG TPA: ceramidase [Myxococcaceae bacterium]|nr:ceramidase [Myxococcaceae bacterium]
MTSPESGYWGPPTSSVDWCERNYEYTPYVSELFNTGSSLAMVLVGVAGILLHRRVLERRFLWAFALVALVGLGSVAFHATLRFELQMLDELPMLYLVLLMVYVLLEDQRTPRFGRWFPMTLVAYGAFLTVLASLTRGRFQFWTFQLSFGSLELFSLARVYGLHRRSRSQPQRRLFRWGIASYALAVVLWFIDIRFCQALTPNPQFHAVWHVLVSFGFYALVLVIAHDRADRFDRTPEIRLAKGVLPYLRPKSASTA